MTSRKASHQLCQDEDTYGCTILFQAVSDLETLALSFLEHVIRVLDQTSLSKATDVDKDHESLTTSSTLNPLPQSATLALGAVFRYNR
jgi:hypothetical protein